jgi:hypothetical protein
VERKSILSRKASLIKLKNYSARRASSRNLPAPLSLPPALHKDMSGARF